MSSTPYVDYSYRELIDAYNAWVQQGRVVHGILAPETLGMQQYGPRLNAWETYCDIRDNLPMGTTQARRMSGAHLRLVSCRATYPGVDSAS